MYLKKCPYCNREQYMMTYRHKKTTYNGIQHYKSLLFTNLLCRDSEIRTHDLLLPKQAF